MTTTPEQPNRGPTGVPAAGQTDSPSATTTTAATGVPVDVTAPDSPDVTAADALHAAKPPVGTGSSPLFAQLIALALISVGVAGVQHLLVSLNLVSGASWISSAIEAGDGIAGDSLPVLLLGTLSIVLGVLLLPVVVRPRPRKGLAMRANTGVYLRRRDVARVLEAALEGIDGITHVDVSLRRRSVRVNATSVGTANRNDETRASVVDRATPVLEALEGAPRLHVTVHNDGN